MTILVTGATGMVGSVLCKRLQTLDIPHLKLSRHPSHSSEDQVFWDPHE
ncbi:MAG: NAD-dependent epimerase/dehydratase family protein, partial [SAR324 cluster bacterium]|nr:NAD-dependent epimerase/dehydratase family protein [SAR324 cluster bacterium]